MRINASNIQNVLFPNSSNTNLDKNPVPSRIEISSQTERSSANGLHALGGQMQKLQLLQKFAASNVLNPSPDLTAKFTTLSKHTSGDEVTQETRRMMDNYHRQVKPSEIKGAPPVAPGMPTAHADAKHGVKAEVQAEILNKPDRIFSGINKNGRFVDIYYKNQSVVITEFGKKDSVITAYGLIEQKKNVTPKPVKVEQFANNPRYVEIKLEEKGATNVIYPNKPRFDADDFPKNPPKPETPPKTNGGSSAGTSGSKPSTASTAIAQEPTATGGSPVAPTKDAIEEAPVARPNGGAASNIARGLILMQLVQVGLAAYDITRLKADGEKFGYYVDPFFNKYILTDPEKAAKNLPEGFKLTFYPDPKDFFSQGQSIKFEVKDGKFVNIDKNYPDYQLYVGEDGTVKAGIIA